MPGRYKPRGWFGEPYRHYLAAKGIKTKHKGQRDVSYMASKAVSEGKFDIGDLVQHGRQQWEIIDFQHGYYTLIQDDGTTAYARPEQLQQVNFSSKFDRMTGTSTPNRKTMRLSDGSELTAVKVGDMFNVSVRSQGGRDGVTPIRTGGRMMTQQQLDEFIEKNTDDFFAHKYFVRDKLKGNRESSALHRAYAKGWTKDELRANPDIREQFGISLAELEPKGSRRLPESTSRAEEGISTRTDFSQFAQRPIPETPIPTTQEFSQPREMQQEFTQTPTQDFEEFDEGFPERPANGNEVNTMQVTTPGVPERSSLGGQL